VILTGRPARPIATVVAGRGETVITGSTRTALGISTKLKDGRSSPRYRFIAGMSGTRHAGSSAARTGRASCATTAPAHTAWRVAAERRLSARTIRAAVA